MKDVFSKKYQKWFRLDPSKKISGFNIFKINDKWYYNESKDCFISIDLIDEYVDKKRIKIKQTVIEIKNNKVKSRINQSDDIKDFDELFGDTK